MMLSYLAFLLPLIAFADRADTGNCRWLLASSKHICDNAPASIDRIQSDQIFMPAHITLGAIIKLKTI